MRTLDEIDPIAAITAEIEKFQKMPDRIGIMSVKSANQWVDDAMQEPDPKTYFYDLLVEGECTVLFASSNAGKSVLATQMTEAVARENTVLYLDCELSAKQFQMRYVEGKVSPIIHRFPDTLLRAEIRPDDIVDTNLEDAILTVLQLQPNTAASATSSWTTSPSFSTTPRKAKPPGPS